MATTIGLDVEHMVFPQQVHGDRIAIVSRRDRGKGAWDQATAIPNTDGLLTDEPGLGLCCQVADCLPLFLWDPAHHAIGLIHAGWRGTQGEISAKAVRLMHERFGTGAEALWVAFGPAIRKCCYTVGEEFEQSFPTLVEQRRGERYLDLIEANRQQVLKFGVAPTQCLDLDLCTACHPEIWFSARRDGPTTGRHIAFIALPSAKKKRGTGWVFEKGRVL